MKVKPVKLPDDITHDTPEPDEGTLPEPAEPVEPLEQPGEVVGGEPAAGEGGTAEEAVEGAADEPVGDAVGGDEAPDLERENEQVSHLKLTFNKTFYATFNNTFIVHPS